MVGSLVTRAFHPGLHVRTNYRKRRKKPGRPQSAQSRIRRLPVYPKMSRAIALQSAISAFIASVRRLRHNNLYRRPHSIL
jgi:hypothetical protein